MSRLKLAHEVMEQGLLARAEECLLSQDFQGAMEATSAALNAVDLDALSRTALAAGRALSRAVLAPMLTRWAGAQPPGQISDDKQPNGFSGFSEVFSEVMKKFQLALRLNPQNREAQNEIQQLLQLRKMLQPEQAPAPEKPPQPPSHPEALDVIVVGAGAAGIGVGLQLTRTFGLEPHRVLLLERGSGVGETFRRWPKEMRFISPSFNQQGWTKSFDLNSVAYGTSPAFTLHSEHPTGEQYANYLVTLAEYSQLNIQPNTEVTAVHPSSDGVIDVTDGKGFEVEVSVDGGTPAVLRSRYVVWAGGEFQYPRTGEHLFPGSEHCRHNSTIRSWRELPGDDFVVIGGYESGMDAAFNLSTCGKRCTVVSSTAFWDVTTPDPSTELAPYTAERVRVACASATPPQLLAPLRVFAVEEVSDKEGGGYIVRARWGAPVEHERGEFRTPVQTETASDCAEGSEVELRTPQKPLLCTGFKGSIASGPVSELFEWGKHEHTHNHGHDHEDDEARLALEAKESGAIDEITNGKEGKEEKDADGCAEGSPLLDEHDESTKTPGLFLVGPAVRHGELSFCFVYKFRQRFAVVAEAIASELGRDTSEAVRACRLTNMFLDSFECCEGACGQAC